MTRAFLDTNVIAYAYDAQDPRKRAVALDVLAGTASGPGLVISTQVLLETAAVLLRGLAKPLPIAAVREIVGALAQLEVVTTDAQLVEAGLAASERWQLSSWDGMIVAAAQQANVEVLLTEDLQDGQAFEGVVVRNPFATR